MRLLLDESIPRRLARYLTGVDVETVYDRNWSGLKNGDLLRAAEADYDGFVTADQNLQYQQNLMGFKLRVAVLAARTNRLPDLLVLVPELRRRFLRAPAPPSTSTPPTDPMDAIQYPTGRFSPKGAPLTDLERAAFRRRIAALPAEARSAVSGLDEAALDTPYREGGWSPRQIVHHLADSHLNAFTRFKLGITEDLPTLKPYDQDRWAETADVSGVGVDASLSILEGLHERWARLLESLAPPDFGRLLNHPEIGAIDLDFLLQLYAWHGAHHVAQVTALRVRRGW